MGKIAERLSRKKERNPQDIPNRETREAMEALDRGEGVVCKDADDLLKKLKS